MHDTGNGLLSAIAVLQALFDRERTGEGQEVDTSIVNAGLLNTSYTYTKGDGTEAERPRLDAHQLGLGPRYRRYETSEGWLCIAVRDSDWSEFCRAIGREDLDADDRFSTRGARATHVSDLASILEEVFASQSAEEWWKLLDDAGVPCEISSRQFSLDLFDDPELTARGWVTSYEHAQLGRLDQHGLLVDFSETPGRVFGPPPMVGQHTREILAELGCTPADVDALCADGVAMEWIPGSA